MRPAAFRHIAIRALFGAIFGLALPYRAAAASGGEQSVSSAVGRSISRLPPAQQHAALNFLLGRGSLEAAVQAARIDHLSPPIDAERALKALDARSKDPAQAPILAARMAELRETAKRLGILDASEVQTLDEAIAQAGTLDEKKIDALFTGKRARLQAPLLAIDASQASHGRRVLEKHYRQALQRMSEKLLDRSALAFPKEPIEIHINPGVGAGPPAGIKERRDKLEVTVPYQWIGDSSLKPGKAHARGCYTKHPAHSLALFYHEIGHAVFRENSENTDSLFKEYFSLIRAFQDTAISATRLIQEQRLAVEKGEKAAIAKLLLEKENAFNALEAKRNSDEFRRFSRILKAFDELFADLTSVLVTENPKSISNVTAILTPWSLKAKGGRTRDASRDFSNPSNAIDGWNESQSRDIHAYFSPARYFLFQDFLRYPRYLSGKGKADLYDKVFLAITRTAPVSLKTAAAGVSPTDMNHLLIEAIKREFSK